MLDKQNTFFNKVDLDLGFDFDTILLQIVFDKKISNNPSRLIYQAYIINFQILTTPNRFRK